MREIFYEYSASGVPPDPTVNSAKYNPDIPPAYAVGSWKAIAREGGELSSVTNKSFSVAPTDYVNYYPLTNDFNDQVGSNNLISYNCTVDSNGCLLDSNSDLMYFSTSLNSSDISILLQYRPSQSNVWRNILGGGGSQCALFCSGNILGYYNGGFIASSLTMINDTNYKLAIVKSGLDVKIYADGVMILDRSDCFSNASYPIINLGGNNYSQSALGILKEVKIFNRILSQSEINLL